MLKFATAIFFVSVLCLPAGAQSTRYYRGTRIERVPERVIEERENKDYDFYLGKIVRKDDGTVIVKLSGSLAKKMKDRTPVFYALDERMRPVAILEDFGLSYKTCATFKIVEGNAKKGDIVMVKYLSPKKVPLQNSEAGKTD